jgi:hypothetical protein
MYTVCGEYFVSSAATDVSYRPGHISRVIQRRNWDSWSAEQAGGSCEDRYHTVSVAACSLVDSCMFIILGQQSRIFTKIIVSDKYRVNSKWKKDDITPLSGVKDKGFSPEPLKYLQILNKTVLCGCLQHLMKMFSSQVITLIERQLDSVITRFKHELRPCVMLIVYRRVTQRCDVTYTYRQRNAIVTTLFRRFLYLH